MKARRVALVLCFAAACSSMPPPQPIPNVPRASPAVAALRVYVVNPTDRQAAAAGEHEVTGFTIATREAFRELLSRAGWTVVFDANEPHDVDLRVVTEYQTHGAGSHGRLMTALTLSAPGGIVEQQSGIVPVLEYADIDLEAVAHLVLGLERSPRVERYAGRVRRPDVPCAPQGPTLAAPGPDQGSP